MQKQLSLRLCCCHTKRKIRDGQGRVMDNVPPQRHQPNFWEGDRKVQSYSQRHTKRRRRPTSFMRGTKRSVSAAHIRQAESRLIEITLYVSSMRTYSVEYKYTHQTQTHVCVEASLIWVCYSKVCVWNYLFYVKKNQIYRYRNSP